MDEVVQAFSALPPGHLSALDVRAGLGELPAQRHVPYHDEAGAITGAPGVHLLCKSDGLADAFFSVCAMDGPADDGEAGRARLFAWMWARPDRWTAWGRIATGLGPGVLARQIELEMDAEAPAGMHGDGGLGPELPRLRRPPPNVDPDDDEGRAERIWCACDDDRYGYGRERCYKLYLSRGDPGPALALFTLRFDTKGPRDRVWDWMQHQTHRYREFLDHLEASGKDSLRKLIFAGMLETERAVKKAGLGSGGTRPLRFWPGPETGDA